MIADRQYDVTVLKCLRHSICGVFWQEPIWRLTAFTDRDVSGHLKKKQRTKAAGAADPAVSTRGQGPYPGSRDRLDPEEDAEEDADDGAEDGA
ncbi:hypothetical protein LSAT2_011412 [Lamellibrachia satsuma]|nr:hypothetical protein LSAT2_011412 [Lamellibrachia satsuma]